MTPLREGMQWVFSGISLSGLIAIGVAYGEQTTTVERLESDVASLSALNVQTARDNERLNNVVKQQEQLVKGQNEQRVLLQQILLNVQRMRNE